MMESKTCPNKKSVIISISEGGKQIRFTKYPIIFASQKFKVSLKKAQKGTPLKVNGFSLNFNSVSVLKRANYSHTLFQNVPTNLSNSKFQGLFLVQTIFLAVLSKHVCQIGCFDPLPVLWPQCICKKKYYLLLISNMLQEKNCK